MKEETLLTLCAMSRLSKGPWRSEDKFICSKKNTTNKIRDYASVSQYSSDKKFVHEFMFTTNDAKGLENELFKQIDAKKILTWRKYLIFW